MKLNRDWAISLIPHFIGLIFIAMIPMFIFDASDIKIKFWTYRFYYQLFFFIIAFYGNYLLIVPWFFFSKKRIRFFLALLLFSFGLLSVSQIVSKKMNFYNRPVRIERDSRLPQSEERTNNFLGLHPRALDDTFFLILVFGFSTGMSILQKKRKDDQDREKLEKTNIENELVILKNQINPHFFFNSLNNIYALIDIDGERAQKSIETLSILMRYIIYESNSERVDIKKEFDFSRSYIALMKQRLTSKVKLTVDISEEFPDAQIPPLLFIAFIENSFKHGVSYRDSSFIDIKLNIIGRTIVFHCINSIPTSNDSQKTKQGGFGIANIKKRLGILYGARAQLTLNNSDNKFEVKLKIPIEEIS